MDRRLALAVLAILAVLTAAPPAAAQAVGFEVASVKPSAPAAGGLMGPVPMVLPALGRLRATNVTLRMLVMAAYGKQSFEVIGGPPWMNAERFDIDARAGDPTLSPGQLMERLRTLLAERFNLKVHTETREMPLDALVVARADGRLGPKLKPSADDCADLKARQQEQQELLEAVAKGGVAVVAAMLSAQGDRPCSVTPTPAAPGAIGLRARGFPVAMLAAMLTQFTGRRVVDKTGLSGLYDFEIALDLQTLLQRSADFGVALPLIPQLQGFPEGPSLATYLQEELGLRLESGRGPGEVLVVDGADPPTPD
jgi:uncharacterized protein (TIGR03435 family)